jgi:tripartite-type tricarboxylate transporter receptor subunit TctC
MRKTVSFVSATLLAAVAGLLPAGAQDYPSKPVRLIVPFLAGAGTDLSARVFADYLSPRLGQPVVVENKPGAGGSLGAEYVAKSPADGYTLLWGEAGGVTIHPSIKPTLGYKADDFTYIGKLVDTGMSYVINAKLPAKNMAEFVAYAKANPDKIKYGTSGIGTSTHFATVLFEKIAGLKMTHVPYKGVAQSVTDLVGGHIEFGLVTPATIAAYRESDKVRIIGISSPIRHPSLPNVPTANEVGLDKATVVTWYGLLGPAKMPAAVTARLNKEIQAAIADPTVKEKIEKINLQLVPVLGADFEKLVRAETAQWKAIADSEKIVVNE